MTRGAPLLLLAGLAAAAPEKPVHVAPPLSGPVRVDGDLVEWRAFLDDPARRIAIDRADQLHPDPAWRGRWGGPADLSARIAVAYDAASLFVAAEVTDDQVVQLAGGGGYAGDALELFLDTDLERSGPNDTYGESEWQLLLLPVPLEQRWRIFRQGRPLLQSEARFQGVQVAARVSGAGYTIEACIPFVNLRGLVPASGARLGFDVALNDADDPQATRPETYVSWNGQADLFLHPSRFGILVLGGPGPAPVTPEAPAGEETLLLPALVALALCLLSSHLLLQGLRLLARRTIGSRILFCASLALLVALLYGAFWARDALAAWRDRSRFAAERSTVEGVLAEARELGLAAAPAGDPPLVRLLRGEAVETRRSHEFFFVEQSGFPLRYTEELRTPCIVAPEMDLAGPGPHSFYFAEGERGDRLHLVLSLRFDALPALPGLREGDPVGEATLHYRGGGKVDFAFRYGLDLDDRPIPPGERSHGGASIGPGTVHFGFPLADGGRHADELVFPLTGPPPHHLDLAASDPRVTLTLHAITLGGAGGEGAFRSIPLRRRWAGVAPAELWPDFKTLVAEKDKEARVPIGPERRADRLWVFYAVDEGFPLETAAPRGIAAALLRVTFAAGQPLTFPLVSGRHLDDRRFGFARGHPRFFESHLAFTRREGTFVGHADVLEVPLGGRTEPVREVAVVRNLPETSERVTVLGLTLGQEIAPPSAGEAKLLETGGPGLVRLRRGSQARVAPLRFTLLRPAEDESAGDAIVEQEGGLSARLDLPEGGEDRVLLVQHAASPPGAGRAVRDAIVLALLALLLPSSLTLLTELLARGRRLRFKLTSGFVSVSVAPLLFLFLFLHRTMRMQGQGELERRSAEALSRAREGLEAALGQVRAAARKSLSDPTLQAALAAPGDRGPALTAVLQRLAARLAPELPGAALVLREHGERAGDAPLCSDPAFRSTYGHLLSTVDRTDLYVGGGTAALFGVDVRKGPAPGRWQELLVGLPLQEGFLRELVRGQGDAAVFVFLPGGFLCAASVPGEEPRAPSEVERLRRLLASPPEPGGSVRAALHAGGRDLTAAFDALHDSSGRTVAILAGAVPAAPLVAIQERVRRLFLILGSSLIVLVVLLGSLMTDRITAPIERLEQATRAVARGELELRVPAESPDEVGALTNAFNEMAGELTNRHREQSFLHRALRELGAQVEPDGVTRVALELFRETAAPDDLVFLVQDRDRGVLRVVAGERRGRALPQYETPLEEGPLREVLRRGEPAILEGLGRRALPLSERRILGRRRDLVALPVAERGETTGLVCLLYDSLAGRIGPGALGFLGSLAQHFAAAAERARLYRVAIVDAESGLFVQPYFVARLEEELARADRAGRPVALLRIDLSDAEAVAARGDAGCRARFLRRAAGALRDAVPRMFLCARAGPWSFAVLAPEAGRERGQELAGRVREALARTPFDAGDERHVTLTPAVGLALFPEEARSAADLEAAAERAVQAAEAGGGGLASLEEEERRAREATERSGFVFRSEKMIRLLETVERIAAHDATVLIQGETGVGKDVFAEMIHRWGPRSGKPFVKVNCGALPETLLESELFGHEKGAFTGAVRARPGRFEHADGGTLFLDEIGEMIPATQVKLLRVLQDKKIERLGGNRTIGVDVRIIAATNRDLKRAIQQGTFREDLWFRLNVIGLTIPPLRERREEIPVLADHFLRRFHRESGRAIRGIAPEAMDLLYRHGWPGNIRELRNTLERASVVCDPDSWIEPRHIFLDASGPGAAPAPPGRSAHVAAPPPLPNELRLTHSRQARLLEFLRKSPLITNRQYFELTRVSRRTGLRDIQDLIRKGLIEKTGSRKGSAYRLKPLYSPPPTPDGPEAPAPLS